MSGLMVLLYYIMHISGQSAGNSLGRVWEYSEPQGETLCCIFLHGESISSGNYENALSKELVTNIRHHSKWHRTPHS